MFVKLLLNVISMSIGMTGGNASPCDRTESMGRDQVTCETLMVMVEPVPSLLFLTGCDENCWTVGISYTLLMLFHCRQPNLLFLHFMRSCLKRPAY